MASASAIAWFTVVRQPHVSPGQDNLPPPPLSMMMASVGGLQFTGYNADTAQGFSFVLLEPAASGTVFYFTDRGWSTTTGFPAVGTEGLLTVTLTNDYSCGVEFAVYEANGMWTVASSQGGSPTVTESGNFALEATGDQIFAYQNAEPTVGMEGNFLSAIQMNGGWNASNNTVNNSQEPVFFTTGNPGSGLDIVITPEVDNAKYDCSTTMGNGTVLLAAISNTGNWDTDNTNGFDLTDYCDLCCDASAPMVTTPNTVDFNASFSITINSALPPGESWEIYTQGCGIGTPVITTMQSTIQFMAPGTPQELVYYIKSTNGSCCTRVNICVIDPLSICTDCTNGPFACGDCVLPDPAVNPPLSATCDDLQLIFIIDESGSIGNAGATTDVRDGTLAFLNALNGSGVDIAIIEFSTSARLVTNYVPINSTLIANVTGYFNGTPFNSQTYSPSGSTNWHHAMYIADTLSIQPDMVILFTDGSPTAYGTTSGISCNNGASVVNPVKLANKMKNEGTHIFMLGVGDVDSTNLKAMSGDLKYNAGVNTIGTTDWTNEDFNTLAQCLEDFAYELCATTISLEKSIVDVNCDTATFRLIVRNLGGVNVATAVTVKDTFPSGYGSVVYTGSKTVCIGSGCAPAEPAKSFVWSVGPVSSGSSDTLYIQATVLATGNRVNTAWATSSTADTVSASVDGSSIEPDTQAPIITCPSDTVINCNTSILPVATGQAMATDDTDPNPVITYTDVTMNVTGPCLTIQRTWLATDVCGNSMDCLQTITVQDTSSPVVTCPPNTTITCTDDPSPASQGSALSSDNCTASPMVSFTDQTNPGSCPANFVINRTWTAVDECMNSSSCVQSITSIDNQPPLISPARDSIVTCDGTGNGAAFTAWLNLNGRATATDLCGPVTWTNELILSTNQCGLTRRDSIRFIAQDACGNADTTTANFIIRDITPPTITPASPITIDCNASPTALTDWLNAHGGATASDLCGMVTWSNGFTSAPEACSGSGIVPVTFYAEDECGNVDSTTANLTVSDDSPPQITVAARDTMVQCEGGANDAYLAWRANMGGARATDDCGQVSWTFAEISNTAGCGLTRTFTVRYYVEDACGNVDSTDAVFSYIDTLPPVLPPVPNDTTVTCPSAVPFPPIGLFATDDCSGGPIFAIPTRTGQVSCDYTITEKWIFTDACGNQDSLVRLIHVKDTVPPQYVNYNPGDSVYFDCTELVPTDLPPSIDNCSAVNAGYSDLDLPTSCPSERIIERTYTSVDVCGNSTSLVNFLVFRDTTPPVLTPALDTLVDCDGTGNTIDFTHWLANHGGATASDNCSMMITWTYSILTSINGCPDTRDDLVRFYATDECGNVDSTDAHFVIQDNTPPLFVTDPQDITIDCGMMQGTLLNDWLSNNGYAQVTEICSSVTWSNDFGGEPGVCGANNSVTITFTATDECDNSAIRTASLTIQDDIPPTIVTEAADTTVDCDGTGNTSAFISWINNHGGADATDDCSAVGWDTSLVQRTILCDFTSTSTYYFIASDACGNADSTMATFTIRDITPPLPPAAPAAITVTCAGDVPAAPMLSATDACAGNISGTVDDVVDDFSCLNQFEITRTWVFTDPCGNSSSIQQTITVNDNVPPVISGVNDMDVIIVSCDEMVPTFNVTATDNCGLVRLVPSVSMGAGSCSSNSTQTLTWTAIDTCQNRTTVSIMIQIVDTTAPVLTVPADTMITCEQDTGVAVTGIATATDLCSSTTIGHTDLVIPGSCRQQYTIQRTWTATDICSNRSSRIQVISVIDTTAPTYTPPENITIDCGAGQASELQSWLDNHANSTGSDNCSLGVIWRYDPVTSPDACGLDNSVPVNFYVADSCGNEASFVAMLTIVDEVAPSINTAARDTIVECDGTGNAADFMQWVNRHGGSQASDDCGTVSWTYEVINSVPGCGNTRMDSVRFIVSDLCDNRDSTYAKFIIEDNLPPMIQLPPDRTILCDEPTDPSFTGMAIATDQCGGASLTFTDATVPGSCPQAFTLTRTWVAIDACNNSNTAMQVISIEDTLPPDMICPPDSFTTCFAAEIDTFYNWAQYVAGGGSATDRCALDTSSFRYLYETSTMIPQGFEVLRYYTVSDSCGNADTCTHRIIVHDNIPPVAICRDSFMILADSAGNVRVVADSVDLGSYDNCGIASITFSPAVVSCTFFYNTTIWRQVTMIVRDYAGNVSTCTTTIQVRCPCPLGTLPPSCADDVTVSLGNSCEFELDVADVLYNDVRGCDDPYKINVTSTAGLSLGNTLTTDQMGQTLIFNVIDTMTGNRCWGRVHVEDKLPPQIECRDLTISCFEEIPAPPVPVENCGILPEPEILEEVYTSYACEDNREFVGYLHRTVRASDIWGNHRECTQNIYIRRESLDNLVCPEPTEIECCAKDGQGKELLWNPAYVTIDENGYPHPKVLINNLGEAIELLRHLLLRLTGIPPTLII
ncbi:MAG: VWA domain-containing protein [Saprospiraceae bacterium]